MIYYIYSNKNINPSPQGEGEKECNMKRIKSEEEVLAMCVKDLNSYAFDLEYKACDVVNLYYKLDTTSPAMLRAGATALNSVLNQINFVNKRKEDLSPDHKLWMEVRENQIQSLIEDLRNQVRNTHYTFYYL